MFLLFPDYGPLGLQPGYTRMLTINHQVFGRVTPRWPWYLPPRSL